MNAPLRQPLVFKGNVIADKGEMLSLTDMWKACGSPADKRPADWKDIAGHNEFIEHVAAVLNTAVGGIWRGTRGRHGGGTMAHWHIGLAYAQWVNHDIHMWCNTAVREKMEGRAIGLDAETLEMIRRTDGIARQMNGKFTDMALAYGTKFEAMHDEIGALRREIDRLNTGLRRDGITSLQAWDKYGLPPKVHGRTQWLTTKLLRLGAGIEFNGRADIGNKAVHLFDPDKVDFFMKETGLLLAARKWADEKRGQGKLKL